jgi:hypothetical protein
MKPCNQLSIEGVREPEKGYRYELKAMALYQEGCEANIHQDPYPRRIFGIQVYPNIVYDPRKTPKFS